MAEKKTMPTGVPFIQVKQRQRSFLMARVEAGRLARVAYAAVRGKDDEPGAVQRLLNPERISSIKQFTLAGGDYPSALVLNWTSKENPLKRSHSHLTFEDVERSAQLIDGQHRLAGIRDAIAEDKSLAKLELPVAIYENLETRECADLFLSINTEQKPVPRSLVYDLYGIASEGIVDPAAVRARDIATFLNEDEKSPYYSNIKFPGSPRRRGGIALSTAVSALKPLVDDKGLFEQIGITELESQKHIVLNFFTVLSERYKEKWLDQTNVFNYAAGFVGALEFFKLKLLTYCNNKKSFKVSDIKPAIRLTEAKLLFQADVKGLSGTEAVRRVYERLVEAFNPGTKDNPKFAI